jgi:hypothetical protein
MWKDKQDTHILMNINGHQQKATSANKYGKAQKHVTAEDYNWHMGYDNKGDRMANSCSSSQRTWKWTKLLFYLLGLTILNSCIILSPCSSKMDHRKFHLAIIQNLLEVSAREFHFQATPRGGPNTQASQMKCLEAQHTEQWSACTVICTVKNKQLPNSRSPCAKSVCAQTGVLEFITQG